MPKVLYLYGSAVNYFFCKFLNVKMYMQSPKFLKNKTRNARKLCISSSLFSSSAPYSFMLFF